jgi:hypothetical protein
MTADLVPQTVFQNLYEMQENVREAAEYMRPFFEEVEKINWRIEELIAPAVDAMKFYESGIPDFDLQQKEIRAVVESLSLYISPYSFFGSVAPIGISEGRVFGDSGIERALSKKVVRKQRVIPFALKKLRLPAGALVEDIEIRLNDAHTIFTFYEGKKIDECDYTEIGFGRKNTKDFKSDKQFALLRMLSIITMKDKDGIGVDPTIKNLAFQMGVTTGALEKIKEDLSWKLGKYFGIEGDPFYNYRSKKGYYPRFTLTPEAELRGDGELHRSGSELYDRLIGDNDFDTSKSILDR